MARARCKEDLLIFSQDNYNKLLEIISSMTEKEMSTPFDFSSDAKKTEAHWGRDKNVRDIIIHLYEWQKLMLSFVENNRYKPVRPFLPEEYSWKTYGLMNQEIWAKHQGTSLEDALTSLSETHAKIMALIETYSNEQLFTKRYYNWTGTTDLGSYFVSSTSSHYEWAIKKLKEHKKCCK